MVRGLIDWMEHGFVEPESVSSPRPTTSTTATRSPASSRLHDPDPSGRVQSSHLYELFCAWAKAAGEAEWKQKGFSQALKAKGLASKASNGMHWLGIKAIRVPGDFVERRGRCETLSGEPDRSLILAGLAIARIRLPNPASARTMTMCRDLRSFQPEGWRKLGRKGKAADFCGFGRVGTLA
jgi:hypothetical protein